MKTTTNTTAATTTATLNTNKKYIIFVDVVNHIYEKSTCIGAGKYADWEAEALLCTKEIKEVAYNLFDCDEIKLVAKEATNNNKFVIAGYSNYNGIIGLNEAAANEIMKKLEASVF